MIIFATTYGAVSVPEPPGLMVDRLDGGILSVAPQRRVWDRTELSPDELRGWQYLVAATARAMLDELPQLEHGCINYWDAGNWSLHHDDPPAGQKRGNPDRRFTEYLLGRSQQATHASVRWGEAPLFPRYRDRFTSSSTFRPLQPRECSNVVNAAYRLLTNRYGFERDDISPWRECAECSYPSPAAAARADAACDACT